MARGIKVKLEFRSRFSEKLMDLGNLIGAGLVFGQFVSGKEFSIVIFIIGITLMSVCYVVSYIVSS